jgi:hypothetical protein
MNGAGKDRRPVPDGHGMGLGDLAPARGVSDGDMAQVACMEWTDLSQTSSRKLCAHLVSGSSAGLCIWPERAEFHVIV